MDTVLLVAYLLIVLALIAVILLQRSEGGGLGMGSANSNGLVSVRGTANLLTRTTAILAALFFATAIGLTILAELDRGSSGILDSAAGGAVPDVLGGLGDVLALPSGEAATSSAPAAADPVTTEDPGLAVPVAPATDATSAEPAAATPAAEPAAATPAADNTASSAPAQ